MTATIRLIIPLLTLMIARLCFGSPAFINEFHYDNAGTDANEGIEIAASAGTDLSAYHLLFYNGTNGSVYSETALGGIITDQQNGFGTVFFAIAGIQNGPDGIALIHADGSVLQFISYEGSFVATDGAASGLSSIDIGVFEDATATPDTSLQLSGMGQSAEAFSWITDLASPGSVNSSQQFSSPVPIPAALPFFLSALCTGLFVCKRKPDTKRCRV